MLVFFLVLVTATAAVTRADDFGWPTYGGDPGGQRYSPSRTINRNSVQSLKIVWEYHTGALKARVPGSYSAAFEATPVLFRGMLYVASPLDDVIALDPETGIERWSFHPNLGRLHEGDLIASRGVATWSGTGTGFCSMRLFIGTVNAQLIALDAASGRLCEDFGDHGSVNLKTGLTGFAAAFHITSAPTILGDVVVVGSSISDNAAVDVADGKVRAYDARTGRNLWNWEPIPWRTSLRPQTGAANTWSTIAADSELGLIYLPTGSAAPDYYGGLRSGDDRNADSIVALEAATGRAVWTFQLVHHDLWDYDVASEPLLFTWHGSVPAVAVMSKMGTVFVLDRRTGTPLYPVSETPTPASDVLGERASATQPSSALPTIAPMALPLDGSSPDRNAADTEVCRKQLAALRFEGQFTPPSLAGSLVFPGAIGGVNWGSAAYDPLTGILYANTNSLPYFVQLIPSHLLFEIIRSFFSSTPILVMLTWLLFLAFAYRHEKRKKRKKQRFATLMMAFALGILLSGAICRVFVDRQTNQLDAAMMETPEGKRAISMRGAFGADHSAQLRTPYSLFRHPIVDGHGNPCSREPWGTVSALNLQTGKIAWEVPHGTQIPGRLTGALSLGGAIVTAGGLVFSAGTREPLLRAYNSATGEEVWNGALPVPAQATPMTYEIRGRQFVVIAAGGHGLWGTQQGDSVVAFGLQ